VTFVCSFIALVLPFRPLLLVLHLLHLLIGTFLIQLLLGLLAIRSVLVLHLAPFLLALFYLLSMALLCSVNLALLLFAAKVRLEFLPLQALLVLLAIGFLLFLSATTLFRPLVGLFLIFTEARLFWIVALLWCFLLRLIRLSLHHCHNRLWCLRLLRRLLHLRRLLRLLHLRLRWLSRRFFNRTGGALRCLRDLFCAILCHLLAGLDGVLHHFIALFSDTVSRLGDSAHEALFTEGA